MPNVCKPFFFLIFMSHMIAYATPTNDLQTLFEEAWAWQLEQNPVFASSLGDRSFNDQWSNNGIEAIENRHNQRQNFLDRLATIDISELSTNNQLNYYLFRRELHNDIDGHQYKNYLMPINQRGGVQSLEMTAERLRMQTVQD